LLPISAKAITLDIVGPCNEKPVYSLNGAINEGDSVGSVTIAHLEANKIPYIGVAAGIHSILNTPVGRDAIEVINEQEVRAYGWCYEVDGLQPDVMPDKFFLKGDEAIKWFYAFSHYKSGNWLSYCEPAYTVRPQDLCK
jgi:hypothetical protein